METLITICEIGLFLMIVFCIYMGVSSEIRDRKNGTCWIHDYKETGKTAKVYFRNEFGHRDYEVGKENICTKCGNRTTFFD